MAIQFLVGIDLNKNELLNATIQNLASAPSSPVAGQIYHNTTTDITEIYDGAAWQPLWGDTATNAFANITDGTNTAAADSGSDTFKLRTANSILGIVVTNDEATHGDSVLFTVNQGNIDHGSIGGLSDDDHAQYILVAGTRAFTADQSMGGFKLTNVATPVGATDAANKAYVDALSNGLDPKASVRVATTANATIASDFENGDTIDGVTLATGDRILIKDQSDGSANGIFTINASGPPTRATDADVSAEVTAGMFVFVEEGTANADSGWLLSTNNPITLGTTALVFVQFSAAGQITAGAGLTKTGNTLDVGAGTGITVNADDVAINPAVVVRKYATDVGDGAATAYTITHNLGSRDAGVHVYDNTTPFAEVHCDKEMTTTNTVTLRFTVAPTTNKYRCVVKV